MDAEKPADQRSGKAGVREDAPGKLPLPVGISDFRKASSEYYYFFVGNDIQNHYSQTYGDHVAAMEKYGVQYG